MVIHIGSELEAALIESARERGIEPEALALDVLRECFLEVGRTDRARAAWERRLAGAASDCGVSLPHSALSSEGLYES